ncbi:MAG: hypothetical protein R3D00_04275 [Bacteroidia bacterium]
MNPELYNQVIKYYRNQLSDEEKSQLEQKFQEDENFSETVRSYVRMYKTIQQYGDQQLNEKLTVLGKKLSTAQRSDAPVIKEKRFKFPPSYNSAFFYWTTAAAVLILVLVFVFTRNNTHLSPDNIYQIYFSPQKIKTYRGDNQSVDIIWKSAALAYGNREFDKAAFLFESIINDSTGQYRSDAWLFLGITRMEQSRFPEAIAAFEHISPGSTMTEDAHWYMALSYLKMNQLRKAKELFTEIAQEKLSVNRSEDAAKILKIFPPVE